ncbi:OmpA family protein [Hydrogenophaga sp.]|uniref:OmpA family protein n=1 Tax=Hydrogenophaga sp. TaxID=1904254 RepID=UPI0025C3308B|nr:OmpA family protein [Hydrogenophaga sp.]
MLGLASLGAVMAVPALAQDSSFYYYGITAGQSNTDTDAAGITAGLLPGVSAASTSTDQKDTAYKLFGGYQFNRNIAVEGGYFNLGHNSFNAVTSPAGTLAGESKVQGLNLDLVGTLPLTERFSALARIGIQQGWSKSSFSGSGAGAGVVGSSKSNSTNVKYGLGVQYEISPSVWVRGEVERYRVDNAVGHIQNVDVTSVSLVFPFGRKPERRMAAAPAYVAPAPAPVAMAPAVVAVAPPPAPVAVVPAVQRVSFSADTLFGFDKATVRPEGKASLDDFTNKLNGTTYESIKVEGYTDRKGSTDYNQTLSGERANSVKDYLVVSGKLDPTKISAVGMGESAPVTKLEDCSDKLPRAQLITCLQPDRRVEVEVTGTR